MNSKEGVWTIVVLVLLVLSFFSSVSAAEGDSERGETIEFYRYDYATDTAEGILNNARDASLVVQDTFQALSEGKTTYLTPSQHQEIQTYLTTSGQKYGRVAQMRVNNGVLEQYSPPNIVDRALGRQGTWQKATVTGADVRAGTLTGTPTIVPDEIASLDIFKIGRGAPGLNSQTGATCVIG